MSRVGKLEIEIPENIKLTKDESSLMVEGPKGKLVIKIPLGIDVEIEKDKTLVSRKNNTKIQKSLHGTIRSLISNAIMGVNDGWNKSLEMIGAGYRAEVVSDELVLTVGYSHPVKIKAPEGINFKVEKTIITVEGADKHLVGEISAKIRSVRPPEPYKGKGIKYVDEVVRRKAGKAAKTQAA